MFDRYWRVVATAICFAVFGIACGAMGMVALPVLLVTTKDATQRAHRAQTLTHYTFRAFVRLMCAVGVMTVEVRGRQLLRRSGVLVLANHPSLIDVVLLLALLRRATCVVKSRLWENPLTRGPVLAMGYISNRQDSRLIDEGVAVMQRGENLLMFPEGTRTRLNSPIRLQRGAVNIALRADCAVTPVVIRVSTPTLTKGAKWYRVPPARPHFVIDVKDDIDVKDYLLRNRSISLAARELTSWLQGFFQREIGQVASA
jgi:1-acyl-sn-glycerol-3-phosphate acyltransferase